ncbi:hypothetical protein HPULCUR_010219 [Helicostylum pulchrum]|uniref:Myb/SANT-like DNA-binding domain-containing protein n=1 Tax=Helicostylum pulchrum TaxID=562976 RepID=A0ABP9YCM0_9FUNG
MKLSRQDNSVGTPRFRGLGWSPEETLLLIETYGKYFDEMNASTSQDDRTAKFDLLAAEFHRLNVGRTPRYDQQSKTKWANLLQDFKRDYAARHSIVQATPAPSVIYDKIYDIVKHLPSFFHLSHILPSLTTALLSQLCISLDEHASSVIRGIVKAMIELPLQAIKVKTSIGEYKLTTTFFHPILSSILSNPDK